MCTTWFLSFWLPNIATVTMMVPIIEAVITELNMAAHVRRGRSVGKLASYLSGNNGVHSDSTASIPDKVTMVTRTMLVVKRCR